MFCAEPQGAVKNIQVTDPTVNSLRVRWDPADGDVRQYNVLYVPTAGGTEGMVRAKSMHVVLPLTQVHAGPDHHLKTESRD